MINSTNSQSLQNSWNCKNMTINKDAGFRRTWSQIIFCFHCLVEENAHWMLMAVIFLEIKMDHTQFDTNALWWKIAAASERNDQQLILQFGSQALWEIAILLQCKLVNYVSEINEVTNMNFLFLWIEQCKSKMMCQVDSMKSMTKINRKIFAEWAILQWR